MLVSTAGAKTLPAAATKGSEMSEVINYLKGMEEAKERFGWSGPPLPIDDAKVVPVEKMPDEIRKLAKFFKLKSCYWNSASFVLKHNHLFDEVKYVVGYAASVIPLEHAWIKVNGVYYDGSWEKFSELGREYVSLWEMDSRELVEMMSAMDSDYAPSPSDIVNLKEFGPESFVHSAVWSD